MSSTQFVISRNAVALIITLIIPLVVSAVTKSTLASRWKAVITMTLTALVVFIQRQRLDTGEAVLNVQSLFDWALTTAVAIASYVGFWKPVVDSNNTVAPTVGIGPKPSPFVEAPGVGGQQ